jgi:hypothetical protein
LKFAIIGGGPAGLYLAILLRRADPRLAVTVYERNRIEDTFGFGVVLSDATEGILAEADAETHEAMAAAMHRWGDIDVHIGGTVITSGGHGFCGISRRTLLQILSDRARALGVDLRERTEAPPVDTLRAEHEPRRRGGRGEQRRARARAVPSAPPSISAPTASSGSARRVLPQFFFSFARNARPLARARVPVRPGRVHLHRRDHRRRVAVGGVGWRGRGRDDRVLRGAVPRGAGGTRARGEPLHLAPVPHGQERPLVRRQPGAAGRRRAHRALLGGLRHQARDGGFDRIGSAAPRGG